MRYTVGRFPMLRRWPRWPSSDDACHLYLGDADRGLCGRRSGDGTSSARELSCLACWWRIVLAWLRVLIGRPTVRPPPAPPAVAPPVPRAGDRAIAVTHDGRPIGVVRVEEADPVGDIVGPWWSGTVEKTGERLVRLRACHFAGVAKEPPP